MPLNTKIVGATGRPFVQDIDARWLMAYAAGLGDMLPSYVDTLRPGGIVGHPLFPVCVEWPVIIDAQGFPGYNSLEEGERLRGVHASHDTLLHRPVRPGDRLTTRGTVAGVERRKPGAYVVTRLETVDAAGAPVCTTWYGTLFLGVEVEGPDRPPADEPDEARETGAVKRLRSAHPVSVSANAAHVYTECSRIWNPIHTDAAVAARAGLPAILLHGTATLALATSRVVECEAGGNPERVRRVAGRFGAMVFMPSEVMVRIQDRTPSSSGDRVRFDVLTAEGKPALRDGLVVLAP